MSRTLFISDLHLDPARPAVAAALADFLRGARDADALYILGDLFEAWLGDDDDAAPGPEVRRMLRDYRAGGPALYLMHGNRDFLLGESFCRDVGAALLPDPTTTELYGIPTLLLHGDTLCTRDVDYQRFRASARDPDWQAALLSRPLAERRRLAGELRQLSREATGDKAPEIMDVTPEEVEHSFSRHGVGRMIHGHTHRPGHHRHRAGERWVLGDWGRRGWYLELTSTGAELKNFPIFS